jgi:chromate transporter
MRGAAPAEPPAGSPRARARPTTFELFRAALWLGLVGFGGGLSVLAALRTLVVDRRRWLTPREFVNTATVAQMLPGGAAANALAYVGLRFGGVAGALAGFAGFVLPGFGATLALAVAYVRWGAAPGVELALGGFNAAVVGIVASLTVQLVRTGIGRQWQMGVAAGALLLSLPGGASAGEIALLAIGAGLFVDLGTKRARLARLRARHPPPAVALPDEGAPLPAPERRDEAGTRLHALAFGLAAAGAHLSGLDRELVRVLLVFLRTGLGAYGGGFAIIPHLKSVVAAQGWLTDRQFADAVAVGKLTPGPVLLVATFIGYLVGGLPAALVATVGIFAAPFLLVAGTGRLLDRVRSRRPVRAALRGLTPAVAGLTAAAAVTLGGALHGGVEAAIAAAVFLTLVRFPASPVVMLALGGAARVALRALGV